MVLLFTQGVHLNEFPSAHAIIQYKDEKISRNVMKCACRLEKCIPNTETTTSSAVMLHHVRILL